MLKDPLLKQIIFIALTITLSVAVIFGIVAYWYYSLLTGWLLGAFASISVFFIKGWVMKSFFARNTTKRKAFIASMVHTFGYFLIFATCLLSLLAINYAVIGKRFFIDSAPTSVVNSPINLFTFIAGIHVIMAGIFVSHIIKNRKLKKAKMHENI